MTYDDDRAQRLLPFDPPSVTAIRIDGSPGVTPIDAGTAEVVEAAGETWLHWQLNGMHHAVNLRHVAELIARQPRPAVVDLREPKSAYSRLQAALR